MAQHYFDPDPESASRPAMVDLVLDDVHLRLRTDRGVFSPQRIDLGTRVLLETVPPPPPRGELLDLGCGYGPVALTMAVRAPGALVRGIDVNGRAVEMAELNAQNTHLDNVKFSLVSEEPSANPPNAALNGPFDAIWSNPPIRIGKPALHTLLRTWLDRLSVHGTAHLVVQRNLGADSLHRWLDSCGYSTERVASRAGYRVLGVQRA